MALNANHQIGPDIRDVNAKMHQGWNNSFLQLYVGLSIVLAVTTTSFIQLWTLPTLLYLLSNPTSSLQQPNNSKKKTPVYLFHPHLKATITHTVCSNVVSMISHSMLSSYTDSQSHLSLSLALSLSLSLSLSSLCLSLSHSSSVSLLTIPFSTFSAAPFGECAGEEDKTWKRWRAVSLPWLEQHWLHLYIFAFYQHLCSSVIALCMCVYMHIYIYMCVERERERHLVCICI